MYEQNNCKCVSITVLNLSNRFPSKNCYPQDVDGEREWLISLYICNQAINMQSTFPHHLPDMNQEISKFTNCVSTKRVSKVFTSGTNLKGFWSKGYVEHSKQLLLSVKWSGKSSIDEKWYQLKSTIGSRVAIYRIHTNVYFVKSWVDRSFTDKHLWQKSLKVKYFRVQP